MKLYSFIQVLTSRLDLLRTQEKGATAVEYALIVGVLAILIIAAVTFFGEQLGTIFGEVACEIQGKTYTPAAGAVDAKCS